MIGNRNIKQGETRSPCKIRRKDVFILALFVFYLYSPYNFIILNLINFFFINFNPSKYERKEKIAKLQQ
jgi:hypothetical protein